MMMKLHQHSMEIDLISMAILMKAGRITTQYNSERTTEVNYDKFHFDISGNVNIDHMKSENIALLSFS